MIDGVMQVASPVIEPDDIPADLIRDDKALAKELKRLEKQMMDHARNLEFEQAAKLRDQIHELQQQLTMG